MMQGWQKFRGYVLVVTAFIACPCHLPITLPLAVGLTSGTALGAIISQNQAAIYGLFTIYFIGGLALGYWLLTRDQRLRARRSRAAAPRRWQRRRS